MSKVAMKTVLDEISLLAWYDLQADADSVAGFYEDVIRLMELQGHPADLLSVHGPGFSGRPSAFEKVSPKLQRSGFTGITDISIFALPRDAHIPVIDYTTLASLSISESVAFIASSSRLLGLGEPQSINLARTMVNELRPRYGFGCTRSRRLGPAVYAIGLSQGLGVTGEEYAEALRISRWGDRAMNERVWRNGLLRDVYHRNFLNRTQLSMQVEGEPLEKWIGNGGGRGTLEQLSSDLSLWRLASEEIDAVRTTLQKARLLFGR